MHHEPADRGVYLNDATGSLSTRELRDLARRRREAEEKLQQHLKEAEHHTPNEGLHEGHHHDSGSEGHHDSGSSRHQGHGGAADPDSGSSGHPDAGR